MTLNFGRPTHLHTVPPSHTRTRVCTHTHPFTFTTTSHSLSLHTHSFLPLISSLSPQLPFLSLHLVEVSSHFRVRGSVCACVCACVCTCVCIGGAGTVIEAAEQVYSEGVIKPGGQAAERLDGLLINLVWLKAGVGEGGRKGLLLQLVGVEGVTDRK